MVEGEEDGDGVEFVAEELIIFVIGGNVSIGK